MSKKQPIVGDLNRIYTLLPLGSERPISGPELSKLTGISLRRVKQIVNILIMKCDIPIAGDRSNINYGYYIITNEEERVSALRPLVSQQNETSKRINKLATIPLAIP